MSGITDQSLPTHDMVAYQAFLTELKALCEKHRMRLIGTCENEGILGEIRIEHLDNPVGRWGNDAPYVLSEDTILPATTLRYYFPTPPKAAEHQGEHDEYNCTA